MQQRTIGYAQRSSTGATVKLRISATALDYRGDGTHIDLFINAKLLQQLIDNDRHLAPIRTQEAMQ